MATAAFQGKGFRSLGQEAIYAAAIRLRRGEAFHEIVDGETRWHGDVIAPVIRDLGATLAMRPDAANVRMPSCRRRWPRPARRWTAGTCIIGDLGFGILPAAAPLAIGTLTIAGMALAFHREGSGRVAISFIGEGGSSLGEWHEAINLCAARRLPAIFCVENNQTALSTPVREQSAVRVFADKAAGYGIPGDHDRRHRRRRGRGGVRVGGRARPRRARARRSSSWCPCGCAVTRTTTTCCISARTRSRGGRTRRCPSQATPIPSSTPSGRRAIRSRSTRHGFRNEDLIDGEELARLKGECEALVEAEARAVIDAPWPERGPRWTRASLPASRRGSGSKCSSRRFAKRCFAPRRACRRSKPAPAFDRKGTTFLEAVMHGVGDALRSDPRVFVYGEDVGGRYGNAFLLLRPLLEEFGDRIINSPLAEGGVLGVCVGAALAGQRPIGEMQFNDFVATGFNQLVNNAAKIRYRWQGSVPMVLRMPWGGLRSAGPYHSQNTEAWFYRTPGLKIVAPSTPHDARALMAARSPIRIRCSSTSTSRSIATRASSRYSGNRRPRSRSARRRCAAPAAISPSSPTAPTSTPACASPTGSPPMASRPAFSTCDRSRRSTATAVLACVHHCSRVLIVHEDTRTGSIGESLAAIIQEEAFEALDAPVRILASLDTPVPYSPPLEAVFLPSEAEIERAARLLVAY